MAEREDRLPAVGGVSASAQNLLGAASGGARLFCCSAGNVADEVIAEYIATQSHDQEEDFKVDS
jgi:hypothetical protein